MLHFDISYNHRGKMIQADVYGTSYLKQYAEAINKFKPNRRNLSMLEWGSGLTSLFVDRNKEELGIGYFLSVEHDKDFAASVRAALKSPSSKLEHVDLTGACLSQTDKGLNYSTYPTADGASFDLVFIDGRRRMECAMMALAVGPGDQTVIIHDYRRDRYQPILAFYDVIEDGAQFRVMRPKRSVANAISPGLPALRERMSKAL